MHNVGPSGTPPLQSGAVEITTAPPAHVLLGLPQVQSEQLR
jgi:hypothetical protein